MHVLCECAFRTMYGAGTLVRRNFVGENARRCCVRWTENRSAGFDGISSAELWRVRNDAYQRDRASQKYRRPSRASVRGPSKHRGRRRDP